MGGDQKADDAEEDTAVLLAEMSDVEKVGGGLGTGRSTRSKGTAPLQWSRSLNPDHPISQ